MAPLHEGTSAWDMEFSVHGGLSPLLSLRQCHRRVRLRAAEEAGGQVTDGRALLGAAEAPARYRRELALVLPGAELSKLLVVPTCQRAAMELVIFGEAVDKEKDKLLEQVGPKNRKA